MKHHIIDYKEQSLGVLTSLLTINQGTKMKY